jgi:hypothetical protein
VKERGLVGLRFEIVYLNYLFIRTLLIFLFLIKFSFGGLMTEVARPRWGAGRQRRKVVVFSITLEQREGTVINQ